MKIIIFSDIHGNLEAFEAFLSKTKSFDYERMYNLGDTIGYGADPNLCIETVKAHNIPSVTGNHEDVALGRSDASMYNPDAKRAVNWCRAELKPENLDYIKNFGDFIWVDSMSGKTLLVHGSPLDKDGYITNEKHADAAFASMKQRGIFTAFVGHTHRACLWSLNQEEKVECRMIPLGSDKISLVPGSYNILNVGSIGQPRDGNYEGCFVIWNDAEHTVQYIRFAYDVEKAQKKIRIAGLPATIADRLATGN